MGTPPNRSPRPGVVTRLKATLATMPPIPDDDLRRSVESLEWSRSGGLFVPAQEPPQAPTPTHPVLGYMVTQVGWHEIGDSRGALEEVTATLQRLPAVQWLAMGASISAAFAARGPVEVQRALLDAWSSLPTARRVQALAEGAGGRNRGLVTPRPLAGLVKLVLARAPRLAPPPTEHPAEIFLQAYLRLCDVVEDADREVRTEAEDPVRNILRFYVQQGEYGAGGSLAASLTRADLLLRRIPESEGRETLPADVFEQRYGVSLGRYLSAGAGVLAYAIAMYEEDPSFSGRPLLLDDEALFRLVNLSSEELKGFFDRTAFTDDDIFAVRAEDPTKAAFYDDMERLRQRPLCFLPFEKGHRLIPLSVTALEWRITEGVYWDITDAYRDTERDPKAGRKVAKSYMDSFGETLERHLERLFRRAIPESEGFAPRLLTGLRTQSERADQEPELDLVLLYGDAFVVVEVKSARLHYRRSVIGGDLDYIETTDLDKLFYGPVAQIDQAISFIQNGAYDFAGRSYDGEAIYPVLVTYGAPLTMWPVWPRFLEEVERRGLLRAPNVRPLAALRVGEAEILAALANAGHSVRDVVAGYVDGEMSDVSFRNYAEHTFADDADVRPLLVPDFDASHERFRDLFDDEAEG